MVNQAGRKSHEIENVKWKKLGSDLVVQRPRYHHFEAFFEIYKMGMVSEARKRKRKNEKNRVGFGRTEVSIPQFSSFFRDLQDGHSFMVIGVN